MGWQDEIENLNIDWNAAQPDYREQVRANFEAVNAGRLEEQEWRAEVAGRLAKLEEQAQADAKQQRKQAIVTTAATIAGSVLCVLLGFVLGRI